MSENRGWFVAMPLTPSDLCPFKIGAGEKKTCNYRRANVPCTVENCPLRRR